MTEDQIFTIFISVWAVLILVSFLLFSVNKNATFKRKVWPIFIVGIGIAFAGFVTWMFYPHPPYLIAYPAIALISFLNIKLTKFCDECGKTNFPQTPFSGLKFCQKCGASLENKKG